MVIVWGSQFCGDVDYVPELCHVETRFGHLWYIPLIPLESYAIIEKRGDEIRGAKIPLSGRSILTAWLRTAFVLGAILCVVFAMFRFGEGQHARGLAGLAASAAMIAGYVLTRRAAMFTRARYQRAIQLAEHLGISIEGRLLIEVAYGQMTAEQAERALLQSPPQTS